MNQDRVVVQGEVLTWQSFPTERWGDYISNEEMYSSKDHRSQSEVRKVDALKESTAYMSDWSIRPETNPPGHSTSVFILFLWAWGKAKPGRKGLFFPCRLSSFYISSFLMLGFGPRHLYWKWLSIPSASTYWGKEKPLKKYEICEVVYYYRSLLELETTVSMTQLTTLFLHIQVSGTLKSSTLFKLSWGILLTSFSLCPVRHFRIS